MKRFKRVIAAALVCILTLCAATGCGGIFSYDWYTEIADIKEYREQLYSGANASIMDDDNNLNAATSTATTEIKSDPDYYLKGYEDYFSSGGKTTVSLNAADYFILLDKGSRASGSGALYRILLYDGDKTVAEVEAEMKNEFSFNIVDAGGNTYKDYIQMAPEVKVAIEVYHLENTTEDESVWAVFELVYGLTEEPALA